MHDPEERPRLRWRMLAWLIAAAILLPVLYVAGAGPVFWWQNNHVHRPQWLTPYWQPFGPFEEHARTGPIFDRYLMWWHSLPAPRSWRRQTLVGMIAKERAKIKEAHAARARLEPEGVQLNDRLRDLSSQPDEPDGEESDRTRIERRLRDIKRKLNDWGPGSGRYSLERIAHHERNIQQWEASLRRVDAQ